MLVTDNPCAKVIAHAKKYQLKTIVAPIQKNDYPDFQTAKLAQESYLKKELAKSEINWILLAGYMRILSSSFIAHFKHFKYDVSTIVNIHPSYLPSFPGKDGYGDAFRAKVESSGITIHFVDEKIDHAKLLSKKNLIA